MSLGPIFDIVQPYLKGKVKRSGTDNIITLCPFHDDRSPSFWLNINNGLWICFSCGVRGNLKSFLLKVGLEYNSVEAVLEPVREQLEVFRRKEENKRASEFMSDPYRGETILPESLLGVYDYKPRALVNAGFSPKLLREFDIGYDKTHDRVTFPIRDLYGNLVGISGRATIPGDTPRYKVYQGGKTGDDNRYKPGDFGENFDDEYPGYRLDSHRFLWNAHNVYPVILNDDNGWELVIIVEGFKACLWLVQHGFPTTVALSGASISYTQRNLIERMSGNPIILFLDNDEAGRKATLREGKRLARTVNELWVATYPEGVEAPDDMTQAQIKRAIYGSEEWNKWVLTTR